MNTRGRPPHVGLEERAVVQSGFARAARDAAPPHHPGGQVDADDLAPGHQPRHALQLPDRFQPASGAPASGPMKRRGLTSSASSKIGREKGLHETGRTPRPSDRTPRPGGRDPSAPPRSTGRDRAGARSGGPGRGEAALDRLVAEAPRPTRADRPASRLGRMPDRRPRRTTSRRPAAHPRRPQPARPWAIAPLRRRVAGGGRGRALWARAAEGVSSEDGGAEGRSRGPGPPRPGTVTSPGVSHPGFQGCRRTWPPRGPEHLLTGPEDDHLGVERQPGPNLVAPPG